MQFNNIFVFGQFNPLEMPNFKAIYVIAMFFIGNFLANFTLAIIKF